MPTGKLLPETDPGDLSRSVFVIHGRDERLRKDLFSFLRAIGLRPKEWTQLVASTSQGSPYIGHVVEAAFSSACAIVAFMTPDDEAKLQDRLWRKSGEEKYDTELTPQPRPNVLFEAGMAFGKAPDKTILVTIGRLRPISDIEGRHAIRLDNSPEKRRELAQRLQTAGCIVDLSGEDWLKTGDFTISSKRSRSAPKAATSPSST